MRLFRFGHFVYQQNKPATFIYPTFSLFGDFQMWYHTGTTARTCTALLSLKTCVCMYVCARVTAQELIGYGSQ